MKNNDELTQAQWHDLIEDILDDTIVNVDSTDDWIQVWKPYAKNMKYGKIMYSNKLNKLRSVTMGEFYGKGIVD